MIIDWLLQMVRQGCFFCALYMEWELEVDYLKLCPRTPFGFWSIQLKSIHEYSQIPRGYVRNEEYPEAMNSPESKESWMNEWFILKWVSEESIKINTEQESFFFFQQLSSLRIFVVSSWRCMPRNILPMPITFLLLSF